MKTILTWAVMAFAAVLLAPLVALALAAVAASHYFHEARLKLRYGGDRAKNAYADPHQ